MLRARNIARCLAATVALAGQAPGQDPEQPDAAQAIDAFFTVESWVREVAVPAEDDEAGIVTIDGATGAVVILRHPGLPAAIGAAWDEPEQMVRRATARALGQVVGMLPAHADEDERERVLAEVARGLTIELELGGRRRPLLGRTWGQAAERVDAGLDGLAVRRSNRWALVFPSQLRAINATGQAARQLPALAIDLGLAARPLDELRARDDVAAYAFRTLHLAQASPDRPPSLTYRGDRIVPLDRVTDEGLQRLAAGIVSHLLTHRWESVELPDGERLELPMGMTGTYRPTADRYDPVIAPPRDQALVAMALAGYGGDAATMANDLLRDLGRRGEGEPDPFGDPSACAAITLAALEPAIDDSDPGIRGVVSAAWRRLLAVDDRGLEALPPHAASLVAAALARSEHHARARSALDSLWSSAPADRRLEMLPWIGWAEQWLADATGAPLAHATELAEMRDLLERHRFPEGVEAALDLAGGLRLDRLGRTAPTSQTARAAAWLATVVDDDAGREGLRRTMRFLMQLSVRPEIESSVRSPRRAAGGIRVSAWDSDQPTAAQALALLAVLEAQRTLGPVLD